VVVLVPGLGGHALTLLPLREQLSAAGCTVTIAPTRGGVGCSEETLAAVLDALRKATARTGSPALLVGHSRGGQLARVAAVRHPDLVGRLVTLGSPLTRLLAVHPMVRVQVAALGVAGSVGVRGLMRASCLWGDCCRRLRAELTEPVVAVPFLSVYSRNDRVVDWRSSLDPWARHAEVGSSHCGMLLDPVVARLVLAEADAMVRPELLAA
jgi:pimeloyl-ACP methyl ester carboxylesterase